MTNKQYAQIVSAFMALPQGTDKGTSIHPIIHGPDRSIVAIEVLCEDLNDERAKARCKTCCLP